MTTPTGRTGRAVAFAIVLLQREAAADIATVAAGKARPDVVQRLAAHARRAEWYAGTGLPLAAEVAAGLHDWLARGQESLGGGQPAVSAAFERSADWWQRTDAPDRARVARAAAARSRELRRGAVTPGLLRLADDLSAADLDPLLQAETLIELADVHSFGGDPEGAALALWAASTALAPAAPTDPHALRPTGPGVDEQAVRRWLAGYRIARELALLPGTPQPREWLATARILRERTDRVLIAQGQTGRPYAELDRFLDRLDDWDVARAADAGPVDALRAELEELLAEALSGDEIWWTTLAAALGRRIADLDLASGRAADVTDLITALLPLVGTDRVDLRTLLLVRLARAQADTGHWPAAEHTARLAVADIEAVRRRADGVRLRGGFTGDRADAYAIAVESAARRGDLGTALSVADLVRSPQVRRLRIGDGAIAGQLADEIRRLSRRTTLHPSEVNAPGGRWRRRLAFEAWQAAGAYADVPEFDLDRLSAALGGDEAALAYFWLDPNRLLVAAVRADQAWFEVRPVSEKDRAILDRLAAPPRGCTNHLVGSVLDDAADLAPLLLPPEPVLADVRRLYVCPHQVLHVFPFPVLRHGDRDLLAAMTVAVVPALALLCGPRPPQRTPSLASIDVADFTRHPGLRDLRTVARSARRLAGQWADRGALRGMLSDGEVTADGIDRLGAALGAASVVQIVTHGRDAVPEAAVPPVLVLYDGTLDDVDLALRRLDADVVLLVACHSGQRVLRGKDGTPLAADEMSGLTAGLFAAGARAVLGSRWQAEEGFASALMAELHGHLLDGAPADLALQRAVLTVRGRGLLHSAAYFWAPYTLTARTLLPSLPEESA